MSEVMVVASDTWIRAAADRGSRRVGMLAAGRPFRVGVTATGPGCDRWGAVEPYGWACLDQSSPSALELADLPVLADYQPPDPADFASYQEKGVWTHRPGEPLLPFVYGRVWRTWEAPRYRDLAAWNAGEKPIGALPSGQQARFVSAVVTPTGVVLERENGNVVPEDGVYVFPVTRFQGRDLRGEPVPEGRRPAWIVAYDGIEAEGPGGAVAIPYQASLEVDAEPVDGTWTAWLDGSAFQIPVGPSIRVWQPAPRPETVVAEQQWLDLDLDQTVLGVLEGDRLVYATLVSTGLPGKRTPRGLFTVLDKRAWADMRSRSGARDPYFVEAVPWVMHFRGSYALHGAYWHWGFGHAASHGCVNLAPRDAAWIFTHVDPILPVGWHSVYADDAHPGTVLRVR